MGFFENPENQDIIDSIVNEDLNLIDSISYPIGSTVLYSAETDNIVIFNPEIDLTNIDHYISLGVVLECIHPLKYIVLFKNVLNQELETILRANSSSAKSAIAAIFKDYVRRFKSKLPDIFSLVRKNVDLILPSNKQMDIINEHQDLLIKQLGKLITDTKAKELAYKLNTEHIYCNISGHICTWHKPTKINKNYYNQISTYTTGYFLPIFILDLTQLIR